MPLNKSLPVRRWKSSADDLGREPVASLLARLNATGKLILEYQYGSQNGTQATP